MKRIISLMLVILMSLSSFSISAMEADEPFVLEAPTNLTATLKYDTNNIPYYDLTLNIPSSIQNIDSYLQDNAEYYEGYVCDPIEIEFEYKYDEYDWNEGPSMVWSTTISLREFIDNGGHWQYYPYDSGTFETVDIKTQDYSFRARFSSMWGYPDDWIDKIVYSEYSNIISLGNEAFYDDASDWAVPELEEANKIGLIPDILQGADLTKPITREEFAEIAVLLYEKTSEKTAVPVSSNPFTDTDNQQILKAYALGVTKGTSSTTFSPRVLINREQCATMLFRTIKVIAPDGDYTITGISDFADQKNISDFAVVATKYMSKLGIVKGDSSGNFMPKATTTAQEATGYGMATREAAILMTVRTYETLK